ncbi:Hypothetical predicted protein [Pelobates cultripes]|uniref:Uncharacterized protein n=1 Tax=Pelobates cultripes TaxID=61616 RepID=A0AAD1W0Y6_PELCU|nr:Hypothetical predicted protein [Pelobates cultripes]
MRHFTPTPSPRFPITHNPRFPAGRDIRNMSKTIPNPGDGNITLRDLVTRDGLLPLTDLADTHYPTMTQTFQYHQLKHFLHKEGLLHWQPREETQFEKLCSTPPKTKIVSKCYQLIQECTNNSLPWFTAKHQQWLSTPWEEKKWHTTFTKMMKSHSSITIQEPNFKFLSHWYITPVDANKYDTNTSPLCWRCLQE